jgi:LysM repeat protein
MPLPASSRHRGEAASFQQIFPYSNTALSKAWRQIRSKVLYSVEQAVDERRVIPLYSVDITKTPQFKGYKDMTRIRLFISIAALVASLAGIFAVAPSSAQAAGCQQGYVVQPGDNLFRIGLRYGLNVYQIQALNGLPNANVVYAGQWLCVKGYVPAPQPQYGSYYTVQWGDTLSSIAWRFNVNPYQLAAYNGISNWNWVYAGQVLRLPW